MSQQSRMNIAIIFSPNWANYILTEVYSIFKNNPSPVKVYLISDTGGDIDTSHLLSHFGEGYETEFINAEETFKKYIKTNNNVSTRFTKYALYRLLLPELIQEDRLLHIDADAMIVSDIRKMYEMDLYDYYMAGAIDIGADAYNLKRPLGLSIHDHYVNAGVLLMNLKKIREDNLMKKWVNEADSKSYPAHDQCILNLTCKNKILILDKMYNVSISTGLDILKEDIKIIHWAGNVKAWSSSDVPFPHFWYRTNREYKEQFGTLVTNG